MRRLSKAHRRQLRAADKGPSVLRNVPAMTFAEIAVELEMSAERVRQLYVLAVQKVARRAPWLADVMAAAERIHNRRSSAQRMIDHAPFANGDGWGGHREGSGV